MVPCLYVVGGWDGQGVVKTVERFNPQEGNWKKVSHHPEIRYGSLPLRGGRLGWSGGGEDSRKVQPSGGNLDRGLPPP
jgi:hypothetical protein